MVWADEVIRGSSIFKDNQICSESYNGQIAAFSVSVALSGLKPAVALYYSEKGSSEVDKKAIVELVARMYAKDTGYSGDFYRLVLRAEDEDVSELRRRVIEYGIALKLAVRTFKFMKKA